jgi:nucleotide-binding universal stress UspA family protein
MLINAAASRLVELPGRPRRLIPMSYKTILVHLNNRSGAEVLLEPAITLASRYNAHLIGMHVHPSVPAVTLPYGSQVGSLVTAEGKKTEEVAATFARMTGNQPFVAEWRALKVPHVDLASVMMDHSRAADLIIAGQTNPDSDASPLRDFPERLALESGRPVLVVPYVGRYPAIGRNVVIAWKSGRESARAIFDALPLLQGAHNVHILLIKERGEEEKVLAPASSIAAALARHGIKPSVRTSVASDLSVGDEILSRLADLDADLLVMGAYGHSRIRELVFGGVTRHISRHMTVPTLLSH